MAPLKSVLPTKSAPKRRDRASGRWIDNVFIERLWRFLKYECVFLSSFETGGDARAGIGRWISYYNVDRRHSDLAGRMPDEAYAIHKEQHKLGVYNQTQNPTIAKPARKPDHFD